VSSTYGTGAGTARSHRRAPGVYRWTPAARRRPCEHDDFARPFREPRDVCAAPAHRTSVDTLHVLDARTHAARSTFQRRSPRL